MNENLEQLRQEMRTHAGLGWDHQPVAFEVLEALIDRVEAAEQALDFHTQRDRELKTLLSALSDRLDEFSYDELSSLIEDGPLDQWGETYKSKLQTAEQAVERAKAVDALQRRDKGALYRRAEAAEAAVQRVRELASEYRKTIPEEVLHSVMVDICRTLDGGDQK